jgi:hypothetical protein
MPFKLTVKGRKVSFDGSLRTSVRNTAVDRAKVHKMSLPCRYMEVDPDVELCFDDKVVPGHSQLLSLSSKVLKEAIKAGSSQGASTSTNT